METLLPAYKSIGENRYRETSGLYWEDFVEGDVFEHRPGRTVLDVDNTYFTLLTLNVQQVHFDAAYAAKTEWKKMLVDSTFTLALLTGMSVRTVSAKVVANLGWDKVKATHPVFAGDTLYAESTVLSKRKVQEPPDPGHPHRVDARQHPGRPRGDELRAHQARPSPRAFARRGPPLLIRTRRTIPTWTSRTSTRASSPRLPKQWRPFPPTARWPWVWPWRSFRRRSFQALADRARAGQVEALRLYYFEGNRDRRQDRARLRPRGPYRTLLYVRYGGRPGSDKEERRERAEGAALRPQ